MRRAAFKACAMAIVVAGACTANPRRPVPLARVSDGRAPSLAAAAGDGGSRRLADQDGGEKRGWGVTVGCIVGVLYLFLAIAIICDELFVPALEVIAEVGAQRRRGGRDAHGGRRVGAGPRRLRGHVQAVHRRLWDHRRQRGL